MKVHWSRQVPSTWRPVIEDSATLQLFLEFYSATKPPLSNMALECLVRPWLQAHFGPGCSNATLVCFL